MVSSCSLSLDDIFLTSQKAYVPTLFSALFQESDRIVAGQKDAEDFVNEYRASRHAVLTRLDLMGCTDSLVHERFEQWRAQAVLDRREWDEDDTYWKALDGLTWTEWRARVPRVLETQCKDGESPTDEIDRNMKDEDPSWLWFDGFASLYSLRAIVSATPDVATVRLDVAALISAGWIALDERLTERATIVPARGEPSGPIIVLAEGVSDIRILRASLERLHPEVFDYFSFLDHSAFRVDGGANYAVKFLKAFAAARVPANIIAVFDNDTAGLKAMREAQALSLPANMACVNLPDIAIARSYPTIGAQGEHDMDINGKACGIELYLGATSLKRDGRLRPVRWTGFDPGAKAHQGEVDAKAEIQAAFMNALAKTKPGDVDAFPELKQAWDTIFVAAARVAEASQRAAPEQRRGR